VITVVPADIAAKRGEDPAVNGSHGREEGGGIKEDDNNKYLEWGGEEAVAPPSCCYPLLLRGVGFGSGGGSGGGSGKGSGVGGSSALSIIIPGKIILIYRNFSYMKLT
jgi:hypothetical protein